MTLFFEVALKAADAERANASIAQLMKEQKVGILQNECSKRACMKGK